MTTLEDHDLFSSPDWPPAEVVEREPRKCRRHDWLRVVASDIGEATKCVRCGAIRDPEKARRGKSSRRLGHDGERRSEKRYGLQKIGERGEITDLRGTVWKAQQKTTRRNVPATWRAIFSQLDATRDGREAAIIFSFVKQGFPTQDFWLVRGETILAMLGRDEPKET